MVPLVPVHTQPAYADFGYHAGHFPHAEAAASEVLSLPMCPELTEAQMAEVVAPMISRRFANARL